MWFGMGGCGLGWRGCGELWRGRRRRWSGEGQSRGAGGEIMGAGVVNGSGTWGGEEGVEGVGFMYSSFDSGGGLWSVKWVQYDADLLPDKKCQHALLKSATPVFVSRRCTIPLPQIEFN